MLGAQPRVLRAGDAASLATRRRVDAIRIFDIECVPSSRKAAEAAYFERRGLSATAWIRHAPATDAEIGRKKARSCLVFTHEYRRTAVVRRLRTERHCQGSGVRQHGRHFVATAGGVGKLLMTVGKCASGLFVHNGYRTASHIATRERPVGEVGYSFRD